MPITLQKIQHRNSWQIAIYFAPSHTLQQKIKQLQARWSKTYQCWYTSYSRENYQKITTLFAGIPIQIVKGQPAPQPPASIPHHKASKLMANKSKKYIIITNHQHPTTSHQQPTINDQPSTTNTIPDKAGSKTFISHPNIDALAKFVQQLVLKVYSPSTIKTYRNEFCQLLQTIKQKPVDTLTVEELKRYMVYAMQKERISENTAHSRLNALKFYFEQVLGRQKFFWEIPRPKKPQQLPKVFSQDEIAAIIKSITNLKHKTMLMLAYSAGLRVSEVVNLHTHDINSGRMTILIQAAKGKKDRIVGLSPVLLVMLREYAGKYRPDKNGYLFAGEKPDAPYSSRSMQEVLQAAKRKAGVIRPGSTHSLRHSFATHLVDKGTDVTMIQKLLGHNDLRTTLKYLHTSNKDLLKIISPLDSLNLE